MSQCHSNDFVSATIDPGTSSLSPSAPVFQPSEPGHPHEALSQPTDAFWWQYPAWADPVKPLYHYPGYGYFDKPLYIDYTMDSQPVVIGYGSRYSFKPNSDGKLPMQQHILKMVSVYNGDDFVQKIPLSLVWRFSRVAQETFPKRHRDQSSSQNTRASSKAPADQILGHTPIVGSPAPSTRVSNWADEVSAASEKDGVSASSIRSARPSSLETAPTDFTLSERSKPASPATSRNMEPVARPVPRDANGNRMLKLDLQTMELPSNQVISDALKWMRDNEHIGRDGQVLDFGPPNLDQIPLASLADYYQAALVLRMAPFPKRLRDALCLRITSMPRLSFGLFSKVGRWIPAQDAVMKRTINVFLNFKGQKAYDADELQKFDAFLAESGNEELKAKVEEIENARRGRGRNESRPREQRGERWQDSQDKGFTGTGEASESEPSKVAAPEGKAQRTRAEDSGEIDADQLKTGRRRRRRQQQLQRGNGKGIEGRHVPGAD